MKRAAIALFLLAFSAAAAGIDGRWISEFKQKAGKRGGPERTARVAFNLKNDAGKLTGTVSMPGGKKARARAMQIQDGALNADRFSFTTVRTGKNGTRKWVWRGTVKDDELAGTRTRDGAKRGQPFIAKRQS